jgi:hypothetical protein
VADIAMCKGDGCPLKETCYRYKARANEFYQSYFAIVPFNKDGTCDHYWKMIGPERN